MVGLTRLVLPGGLWAEMETDVRQKYPEEACGILAGSFTNGVYQAQVVFPLENIFHSSNRFRVNPQQQVNCIYLIQSQGLELIAIYHSHPQGGTRPSSTDQGEFFDPAAAALIWYPVADFWECRAYVIDSQEFVEIPIEKQRGA